MNRKILAVLLAGIAPSTLGLAYFTGVLGGLTGNNHHTTTITSQPPSLSAEYTGSKQLQEPCNSYYPCGYVQYCYPMGASCENNFTITNKGNESVIINGYRFPDGQSGFLWQSLTPGENFALSVWDGAGYASSSITLTTLSGYAVTLGTMPPQSITIKEGHGLQDSYHLSLELLLQSNSSIPSPVNFTSYSIRDSQGNTYTNSSLGFRTMPASSIVNGGYGPPLRQVTLDYSPGFIQGSNYTITLNSSMYGSFQFQVIGGMFQGVITKAIQFLIVMDGMNATGSLLSMHFTVSGSSISLSQVLVYSLNTVIGSYMCPSSCSYSGSSWLTVTLTTAVSTDHTYWIALSFGGDAPGYYVTF